jgi:hypothetical protein
MQTVWFSLLVSTICLEGLGRKYLPGVPPVAFYFLKDVVLLYGWYRFRPGPEVRRLTRYLYRGFGAVLAASIGFTVTQIFNPSHESWLLALIGLRSYWLWWIAPTIVATVLAREKQKRQAIYALLVLSFGISAFAAVQFASPPDARVNLYSVVDGEEQYAAQEGIVASTGRARVASTFSFVSGFSDFTVLVPALLLSIGLEARTRNLRRAALAATLCAGAVVPMSGSRASVILGAAVLLITMWSAGLFFTRLGRRVVVGGVVAGILAVAAAPQAFTGVQDRFSNTEETTSRFRMYGSVVPPIALAMFDYPMLGIGTGMQHNARMSMRIRPKWEAELENERYLIELGPAGFLLVWTAKLGLMVALLRAYKILKRAGRRGSAGAALSYAVLTMLGTLTYDHVWQALFMLGCGFILAEVMSVVRAAAVVQEPEPVAEPAAEVAVIQPAATA